jgi:peptidoglycan/LPS O-acetylase OafA/YrhL
MAVGLYRIDAWQCRTTTRMAGVPREHWMEFAYIRTCEFDQPHSGSFHSKSGIQRVQHMDKLLSATFTAANKRRYRLMFGLYRILLALMVVLLHYGLVSYIGEYAVFGFFSLSGYLMTLVMQQNYGYNLRGIAAYGLNRFLRIYPIYWVACAVSIGILLLVDTSFTTRVNMQFALPENLQGWAKNLGLVIDIGTQQVLIAPAWALTVELTFYAAIGLGLSRNKSITLIWLAGSLIYTAYMLVGDASWTKRYFGIFSATLPFSTGAAIYHFREELQEKFKILATNPIAPILMLAAIVGNWAAGRHFGIETTWSFYGNYILCSLMIVSLCKRTSLPFISRSADKWLGDLSYPIYLVHFQLSFLFAYTWNIFGFEFGEVWYSTLLVSLVPLGIISWLMAVCVEHQIEKLRSLVKNTL